MSLPLQKVKESGSAAMQVVNSVGRLLRLKGEAAKTAIAEAGEENAFAFLAELFRGNGWTVAIHAPTVRDRAILLSAPKQPDNIILIVKLFTGASPVSYDRARQELTAFENGPGQQYACSQFSLISLNGFEAKTERLENYNLLLQDWSSVEDLMVHYSQDKFREPRIQLFAHNKQTYKKVRKLMERSNSVAVVQATGTGKSYLIAKLLQDFAGERKLVMAPSYYVINQIKEHIRWEADKIEFMTYARSMNLSAADVATLNPRMIVLDEFHRCGAEEWGRGVQNIINAYPDAFKFGTSATPVRYLDNGRDMSQELFNGHVAENLSLAQAIVRNILPMPKYVCALYTLSEEMNSLRTKILGSRKNEETKKRLLLELDSFSIDWERSRGIPHVLKKHLQKNMRKFLIFCKDEEHLREMEPLVKKWFKEATDDMPIKAYRVYDGEPNSDANLEDFKNDLSKDYLHLLFSINMLNEGLHVNEVSGVVLLRPTESPNIFYQQIGRCLKVGLNHRPVIFDFVNNFRAIRTHDFLFDLEEARKDWTSQRNDDALEDRCPKFNVSDEVREITEVFGEIKFKLDNWEEMFETLVGYKNQFSNLDIPKRSEEYGFLFKWLYQQRKRYYYGKLNEEQKKKLSELGVKWTFKPGFNPEETWESSYNLLAEYVKTHGHDLVSIKEDPSLARWVGDQRTLYRRGRLSEDRIKKLEKINFHFDVFDAWWEEYYNRLVNYKKEHGTCNVSPSINSELSNWIFKARSSYRAGKLSHDRFEKLKAIGFSFDPDVDYWKANYDRLAEFINKHGHHKMPRDKKHASLISWLDNQRFYFHHGNLSEDKYKKLQALGLHFIPGNTLFEQLWQKNYDLLVEYKKKHGNCNVSKKQPSLNSWIVTQRSKYHKGKLSEEKSQKLKAIGVEFTHKDEVLSKEWEKRYLLLVDYYSKNGDCLIPFGVKEYKTLSNWAHSQRESFRNGTLDEGKIKKLKAINFTFDRNNDLWNKNFNALVEYKSKHGDCNVPNNNNIKYGTLKGWVNHQRGDYKTGTMEPSRLQKLTDIGFVFNPENERWEKWYNILHEFIKKHGHSYVLPSGKKYAQLNGWVLRQRRHFRNGKLQENEINQFKAIGFEFETNKHLEEQWLRTYQQLVDYKNKHGHCIIDDKQHSFLSAWTTTQRMRFKKGKLSVARKQKLDEIGFEWERRGEGYFEKRLNDMIEFKEKHGHLKFPEKHPLYSWRTRLKTLSKEGKLTKQQIEKLNAIGFLVLVRDDTPVISETNCY